MKMPVFFLAKCVRNAIKTMVVDRKKQKALALLYLASKPLRKAANSSRPSSNRTDKANLNFSPELYRLIFSPKLNFSPFTKKTAEYSFELFFPLTNLFLTFVVFACFATTWVNMRFRAKNTSDSAQGYIQCMKCIGNLWFGRTYVRTDGHVTIMSVPKFLGLIAELLRGRRPREWSPIVILKGVLVIFYGHGKRNGSRARAPYIHTYIRTYVAFHDILT